MSGYVIACYSVTVAALGSYAAWVIAKYRAATKRNDA
jgi:hypothetical protein